MEFWNGFICGIMCLFWVWLFVFIVKTLTEAKRGK